MVSAFWHGFYPGYYNTFFFLALIVEIGKDVYRTRHFFNFIPYPISEILRNMLILTSLNYLAVGMILLDLSKGYAFYKKYYFFGHIGLTGAFIFLRFILKPMVKSKKDKKPSTGETKADGKQKNE